MSKPGYIVSIPSPCHQNWYEMSPAEKGKFCNACQENVIDFSLLSDQEIYKILSKQEGRICGRFTSYQLSHTIEEKPNRHNLLYRFYSLIAGFFLLNSLPQKIHASSGKQKPTYEFKKNIFVQDSTTKKQVSPDSLYIEGTVIDGDNKEVLVNAMVTYGNSSVYTDELGNFKLVIKADSLDSTLKISYFGYKTHVFYITNTELPLRSVFYLFMEVPHLIVGDLEIKTIRKSSTRNYKSIFR